MSSALNNLGPQLAALASQALHAMQADVDDIIQRDDRDLDRIEHLLDGMLGFCYDPAVLAQFKRLCRHYWALDPVATTRHVHAYRDMWDGEGADSAEVGGLGHEF